MEAQRLQPEHAVTDLRENVAVPSYAKPWQPATTPTNGADTSFGNSRVAAKSRSCPRPRRRRAKWQPGSFAPANNGKEPCAVRIAFLSTPSLHALLRRVRVSGAASGRQAVLAHPARTA